jgi:hypothetical protein
VPVGADRPGLVAGEVLFWVLLVGGLIWLIVYLAQSRSRGIRAQSARWQHAVQVCTMNPQFKLGHVTTVMQAYPNRGTMAWITWYGTTQPQQVWFEQAFPPQGSWVVVSGSTGYGPHNQNPQTFYVHRVHDIIV